MLFLLCDHCPKGLRISPGEPGELEGLFGDELDYTPGSQRCYDCGKTATFCDAVDPEVWGKLTIYDVTPAEAFAALNGLGVPEEQECSAAAVEKLFDEHQVTGVRARMIRNSHRCIIDYLEFDNGTKMYFGSSSLGATVYRIAPRHSYAEHVHG